MNLGFWVVNNVFRMKFLKKRLNQVLLIIVLFATVNCNKAKILKDDQLSISRVAYNGKQLRLDGYYYYLYGDSKNTRDAYFFYDNGITLYADTYPGKEITQEENSYKSQQWQSTVKKTKYYWGVFIIEAADIKFERWYPSDPPLKSYVSAGKIINDTTFNINERYRMQNGQKNEIENINETYHFKNFPNKPDSTNNFIQ
jgi:hypothetical protein